MRMPSSAVHFLNNAPPPSVDELLRFELATDAVENVLATMNEHTFVNIVLLESEVDVVRVV